MSTTRTSNINLRVVIVIYNSECEVSKSLSSILKLNKKSLELFVCDNSTRAEIISKNELFCSMQQVHYINMQGNAGLSRAYNRALMQISHDKWVVLFDQDTYVNPTYFDELEKSILLHPNIYIHVPVVKSKGVQISPCLMIGHAVKRMKVTNYGLYSNITAINTGMAIRASVFEKTGNYNELIFLDHLDHYFIRNYRKFYKEIAVFHCILEQEFSDHDHSNIQVDVARFIIYKKDFYIFCKDSISGHIYYMSKILYRTLKLTAAHKSFVFIEKLLEGPLK